jgi:hypothetical protein
VWYRLGLRLKPTRRRVVVYILVVFGILLLRLVVDVWAGAHLRAVSGRIAPEYGGRLDLASLAPPAVAPAENRARIAAAAAALTTLGGSGPLRESVMLALTRALPADEARRQVILREAVEGNRLALTVLDEIRSRSQANWDISYGDGPRMRLPSLLEIRDLSSLNAAAGTIALTGGRADEAARRAGLGMALASSLGREPNLLVQLMHIAAAGVQARLVQSLLAGGEPSGEALESLAASIEQGRAYDPVVTGLVGELKFVNSAFDDWELGGVSRASLQTGVGDRALLWFIRPGTRAAHARALEDLHRTIQYARLRPFEREAQRLRLPLDEPQPWWWRTLSPMFLAGISRSIRSGDEHRAIMMLAATGVALRRCRLGRGSYPASLDELAPVFLPRTPVDPFTGHEPGYRRSGTGFALKVSAPPGTQGAPRDLLNWSIPR